jgi:hypothetical protein
MSETTLSNYGWFYNIVQAQTLVLGYGITLRDQPVDRLLEYSNHAAAAQQFINLYYGDIHQIKALERYVKKQWSEYRLELSNEKLEWLDPKWGLNLSDLEQFVADRIINYPYDTIKKVKTKYLPFTINNPNLFTNIQSNPELFLDEVNNLLIFINNIVVFFFI